MTDADKLRELAEWLHDNLDYMNQEIDLLEHVAARLDVYDKIERQPDMIDPKQAGEHDWQDR